MTDLVAPGPDENAAKLAFQVQVRIQATLKRAKEVWVDLARDLFEFGQAEMWRDLGYTSFGAWMADPDIDIEPRWGYILTQLYKEFVITQGGTTDELRRIEPSKAQVVLPALRRGHVNLQVALADCASLGRDDLRERYHGQAKQTPAGRVPDESTSLDAESEDMWAVCSSCGSSYRVRSVDV